MIKRKLIFVLRLFILVRTKKKSDKTEVDFCFLFISSNLRKKTENDKTEVDFCFLFISFNLRKKQKMIKRKLIFVFRLFV